MFWVIDKSKNKSYINTLSTVHILLVTAAYINNVADNQKNIVETSTNAVQNEINEVNK